MSLRHMKKHGIRSVVSVKSYTSQTQAYFEQRALVGEFLNRSRTKALVTIPQASKYLGLTESYLRKIEQGALSLPFELVGRVCFLYDIAMDDLMPYCLPT